MKQNIQQKLHCCSLLDIHNTACIMAGGNGGTEEYDPGAEKCTSDPNFAVICAFLAEFGQHPSIIGQQTNGKDKKLPDIGCLQTMIENSDDKVDDQLIGFHVKVCCEIIVVKNTHAFAV